MAKSAEGKTSIERRKYFVAYKYWTKTFQGEGRVEILRREPIKNMQDIESIEASIKANNLALLEDSKVCVLNWREFEK